MRAAPRRRRAAIKCRAQHAGHAARRRVEEPEGRQVGISDAQRSTRRYVPVLGPTMVRPSRNGVRSAGLSMPEIGRASAARSSALRRAQLRNSSPAAYEDSMAAEEVHGQGRGWPPAPQRTELRWGGARSLRRTCGRHRWPFGSAVGRASAVPSY